MLTPDFAAEDEAMDGLAHEWRREAPVHALKEIGYQGGMTPTTELRLVRYAPRYEELTIVSVDIAATLRDLGLITRQEEKGT